MVILTSFLSHLNLLSILILTRGGILLSVGLLLHGNCTFSPPGKYTVTCVRQNLSIFWFSIQLFVLDIIAVSLLLFTRNVSILRYYQQQRNLHKPIDVIFIMQEFKKNKKTQNDYQGLWYPITWTDKKQFKIDLTKHLIWVVKGKYYKTLCTFSSNQQLIKKLIFLKSILFSIP